MEIGRILVSINYRAMFSIARVVSSRTGTKEQNIGGNVVNL